MADEDKKTESVSLEQFNELKSRYDKLEKIFEERQTKTYDKNNAVSKEMLLKTLGIEKDPQKTEIEVVSEKFTALTKTVEQLQADLKAKDEVLTLNTKKQAIREAAKAYNFIDVNDVLGVFDYTNDDIDGQLKQIAETKKHWVNANVNQGQSFSGSSNPSKTTLEAQLRDAYKNNDIMSAIALKRQIAERN